MISKIKNGLIKGEKWRRGKTDRREEGLVKKEKKKNGKGIYIKEGR